MYTEITDLIIIFIPLLCYNKKVSNEKRIIFLATLPWFLNLNFGEFCLRTAVKVSQFWCSKIFWSLFFKMACKDCVDLILFVPLDKWVPSLMSKGDECLLFRWY